MGGFIPFSESLNRFEFCGIRYKFIMYASNNSELANTYYSNGNKKVELTEGEVYTIIVRQYSETTRYEIIIITPL